YDEQLKPGDNIVEGVSRALASSDILIAVVSGRSETAWVNHEVSAAVALLLSKKKMKRIIPVRLEEVRLPESLAHIKSADLFPDSEKGLTSLIAALADTS